MAFPTPCRIEVRVQAEPIDAVAEQAALTSGPSAAAGAIVAFHGLCRDEGGRLSALELEYYPGMAEAEITRIAGEASKRWPLLAITAIHRHGLIAPGDTIVVVMAASPHRRAAFAGAEFVMDFLKSKAPFWKREHLVDGTIGAWVDARHEDAEALARWDA